MTDDGVIFIESSRHPGEPPACKLLWGRDEWLSPAEAVRDTALDLIMCATYAEMTIQLIKTGLPAEVVARFVSDIMSGAFPSGKEYFGHDSTIKANPAGSSKDRQAYVLIERGRLRGKLTPAEACGMALEWLRVAEASQTDHLISEALAVIGERDQEWVSSFFDYLRALRHGV